MSASRVSKSSSRTYQKFQAAHLEDLIGWFTEIDERGCPANSDRYMTQAKLTACAQLLRDRPQLDEAGYTKEMIRDKLNLMIRQYKDTKDWLSQTGEGLIESGVENTTTIQGENQPCIQGL